MNTVTLADVKARLSELIAQAETGEAICITRRGRPVAQLTAIQAGRKPLDLAAMRALTERIPLQAEGAEEFVRRMRGDDRY